MNISLLSVVTLFIGSVAFAQPDPAQSNHQTRAITFFVNDQAFIGSLAALDPNEIERIEVDKTMGDAIRIYTKKDARKRFVALDRYLRKQFKGFGKGKQAEVFANGVVVDAPADAVLLPTAVKSVSRTFTPDGAEAYRIETLEDTAKQPKKGGIRIRGTASNGPTAGKAMPQAE